jgi:DNA-binding transcriptional ArsR family regulator
MRRTGAVLVLVLAALLVAGAAHAHAIDRYSSFMQLDLKADLVALASFHMAGKPAMADVKILKVYRAGPLQGGRTKPEVGEVLKVHVGSRAEMVFGKKGGVSLLCAEYRQRATEPAETSWSAYEADYALMSQSVADFEEGKPLALCGFELSEAILAECFVAHTLLDPWHREKLDGELRAKADAAIKAQYGEATPSLLFADERLPLLKEWLEGNNGLLALSAAVDAYEIADQGMPASPLTQPRFLNKDVKTRLKRLGLTAFKSPSREMQSAGLAVLERIGFPPEALPVLRNIVAAAPSEYPTVVYQEAHRYLGQCPGVDTSDLKLLVKALADPSRLDLDPFVAEAIPPLLYQCNGALPALLSEIAELLGAKRARARSAALTLVSAANHPEAYRLLARCDWAHEPRAASVLRQWIDPSSLEFMYALITGPIPTRLPNGARVRELDSLVAVATRFPELAGEIRKRLAVHVSYDPKDIDSWTAEFIALAKLGEGRPMKQLLMVPPSHFSGLTDSLVEAIPSVPKHSEAEKTLRLFLTQSVRVRQGVQWGSFNDPCALVMAAASRDFGAVLLTDEEREALIGTVPMQGDRVPTMLAALLVMPKGTVRDLWLASLSAHLTSAACKDNEIRDVLAFLRAKPEAALCELVSALPGSSLSMELGRAQAKAALNAEKGASAMKDVAERVEGASEEEFAEFLASDEALLLLQTSDCRFLLQRMIKSLDDPKTDFARRTRLVSRLTNCCDGMTDQIAMHGQYDLQRQKVAARWKAWRAANEKLLRWDAASKSFKGGADGAPAAAQTANAAQDKPSGTPPQK